MTSGGSRNRSGPQKDPNSLRSEKAGVEHLSLPADGYDGPAPDFPLPDRIVWDVYFVDKQRIREKDEEATEQVSERERDLWAWAWALPQAAAWAREPWRLHTIAMWVRTYAICESSEATAADKSSLHRFADQIGMTPAGLRENGWQIRAVVVEEDEAPRPQRKSSRERLSVVPDAV